MQIPIITNESLAQMTLMQLTAYVLRMLSEALPHVENIETAETNAKASAEAAAATANGFDAHVTEKTTAFDAHVIEKATAFYDQVDRKTREFNTKVAKAKEQIDNAVISGLDRINAAIETVLTTEV